MILVLIAFKTIVGLSLLLRNVHGVEKLVHDFYYDDLDYDPEKHKHNDEFRPSNTRIIKEKLVNSYHSDELDYDDIENYNDFHPYYYNDLHELGQFEDYDDLRRSSTRIIKGLDAKIEDFPYYAGLNGCGAAILSKRWVVTAAHCVSDKVIPVRNFVWVGGETYNKSKRLQYDIIIKHPKVVVEDDMIPQNDIALLHLARPLKFTDKIKPVVLPGAKISQNPKHEFVGRGIDETGSISTTLKKMEVLRLSSSECLSYLPQDLKKELNFSAELFEKVNICAKRPDSSPGLCHGDSGSPLVQGNTLVGLASYNVKPCEQSHVGFYENVASYVPWITSVTGVKPARDSSLHFIRR